jgi:glutaredoxin/glutathione-dependent peroxiredoxin
MAKVGDKVPSATLRMMGAEGPKAVTTEEVFAPGKTVVAFALPGAFTPTCSAKHVPGFVAEVDKFKGKGVDTIACISVNDAFVMGAWGKDQKVGDKVLMLGDGNAEFTEAMGLTLDASKAGLGKRSQRYAMVVKDGVIKDLFVEKPGAFEVSSAENVLKHL